MKKQTLVTVALSLFILLGVNFNANAQFGKKLKNAARSIGSKKKSKSSSSQSSSKKSGGNFSSFNDETDEMGITGQYFALKDKGSYGFRFVKESEGKVVNELHYFEKKADKPAAKFHFKENYYRKFQMKMFFFWASSYAYVEIVEVDPGVFAQIQSDRTINSYDKPVPIDAKRTVVDVYAKDKASFDTWDVETAQAKLDMLYAKVKSSNSDKVKKKLMRFEAYKNYVGKIAFAKTTRDLKNMRSLQPTEKVANFITKRELGATTAYKPYFDKPIEQSHPGAWFNVTYEMAGFKTDREALRKSSSFFSKNIPQYDDEKNNYYFQWSKSLVNNSSNRADYAFLELLRLSQDKLESGHDYDLKVTVWAYKDGANIDPIATGTIQFEYTPGENGSKKLLFDPINGWITKLEDYMDE
jgi:hypothetical protein